MKLLIYVPLAPQTPKIYARSLTSIFAMQWSEPCEIIMGRNDMKQYPGHSEGYLDLVEKHNRARIMALDGGYDALLFVESDMILPPLTLERLTRIDADVVYGLYVSRHGTHKWLAFDHITADPYYGASLSDDPTLAIEAWGQAVETQGVGMGCTLIKRRVLEQIEFRCPDTKVADDWFFAIDAKEHGFKQVTDCGTVCGHIQGAPDPKIFWPEPDGKYSVQFFDNAMPDTIKMTNGYQVHLSKIGSVELFAPQEAE